MAQKLQLTRLSKRIDNIQNVEDFLVLFQELWKKCKFPDSSSDAPSKNVAPKRSVKDPNAPKRARNAFMFMSDDRRETLKQDRPDLVGPEIIRELGRMWREDFGPEDKAPFEALAAFDQARYESELLTYKETGYVAPTFSPRKVRSKRITKDDIPEPEEQTMSSQTASAPIPLERVDSQETVVDERAFGVLSRVDQHGSLLADDEATQVMDSQETIVPGVDANALHTPDTQETIVMEEDEDTTQVTDSQETIVPEVDDDATQPIDPTEIEKDNASTRDSVREEDSMLDDDELIDESSDPDPSGSPFLFRQRLIDFLILVGEPTLDVDSILRKYSSGEDMFEALEAQYGSRYEQAIAPKALDKEPPLEDLLEEVAPKKIRKLPAFITAPCEKSVPNVSRKTSLRKAEAVYRKQIGTELKAENPSLDRATLNTVLREGWASLSEEAQLAFLD